MIIKIAAVICALIGVRRLIIRYRRGGSLTLEFFTWLLLWTGIGVVVFIPHYTDVLAQFIGVSSGFNALTFLTITGLLFAVYQLFTRLQAVERDLTSLVRAHALDHPTQVGAPSESGGRQRPASTGSPPSAS